MSKCVRCGGSFLTRRKIKLKDAEICGKCYKELGFDNPLTSDLYKWEDIKDGRDAYRLKEKKKQIKEAVLSSITITGTGPRELICTEEEREIFNHIFKAFEDNGRDTDELVLVRKSDNYVTVVYNEWDLLRIKFSQNAKWILFPILDRSDARIYIESPEEVLEYMGKLGDSLAHIDKYSK